MLGARFGQPDLSIHRWRSISVPNILRVPAGCFDGDGEAIAGTENPAFKRVQKAHFVPDEGFLGEGKINLRVTCCGAWLQAASTGAVG